MKTQIRKPEPLSHTIQHKTKAANQAPISKILQAYKDRTATIVQREAMEDEDELLQGKFEIMQREAMGLDEEEEPVQGKFEAVQQEALPEEDEEPIQQKAENKTGLPDDLKSGVEAMSGYNMDDVRVHYNSSKPAQLQALAYTQGTDIHVGPGQEKHLPHEAWHVVQQKQGRVRSTMQMQGVQVNDDEGLEREADVKGYKSFSNNNINGPLNINQKSFYKTQKKRTVHQFKLPPLLREMKLDYQRISSFIPDFCENRLSIANKVTSLRKDIEIWSNSRQNSDSIWQHWKVYYEKMEVGDSANLPKRSLYGDSEVMENIYFQSRRVFRKLMYDMEEIKKMFLYEYYFEDGTCLNVFKLPENLCAINPNVNITDFNANIKAGIRSVVCLTKEKWYSLLGYHFNPCVEELGYLDTYPIHWTLYENNIAGLDNLSLDSPINSIKNSLIPSGSGAMGVHVSLNAPRKFENDKPRVFGRPASQSRRYNSSNKPNSVKWENMEDKLNQYNETKEDKIANKINSITPKLKANWRNV